MAGEGTWCERVLIALKNNNSVVLNEYYGLLSENLESAKKCSDADLLVLFNSNHLFRDLRAECYIPPDVMCEDSKRNRQVMALK